MATGIIGLDTILSGGLWRGGVFILAGAAGTGKTVLSNQIAFSRAARGESAVYVSMLAESHSRLVQHLSTLSFFRAEWVPERVIYLNGFATLEQEGLDGLSHLLQDAVRERRASFLVVDSLASIIACAKSPLLFKRFIRQLSALCELMGCTALVLSHPRQAEVAEASLGADGYLELTRRPMGERTVREFEVHKLRGSGYVEGTHAVVITDEGVTLHPRTEALLAHPAPLPPSPAAERLQFGVRRLDEMLRGGLVAGSTTALVGASGSGKTLLGMHFLAAGIRKGERGLYFGFFEPPARLLAKTQGIGVDLAPAVEEGRLELLWQQPLEQLLDDLAERLLAAVYRLQPHRLFIDGAEGFALGVAAPERLGRLLIAVTHALRRRGVTTLVSTEASHPGPDLRLPGVSLSASYDNILLLRYVEVHARLHRVLSIVKVRESDFDPTLRELRISPHGLDVEETFGSAETRQSGPARPTTPPRPRKRGAPRPRSKR